MRSQHRLLTLRRLTAVADNSCSPLPGLHLEAVNVERQPQPALTQNPRLLLLLLPRAPLQVQLILPEALKLLPLYSLALHKSAMMRPDVRADDRSAWLAGIVAASPQRTMGLLHPRLFAVHNLLVRQRRPAASALVKLISSRPGMQVHCRVGCHPHLLRTLAVCYDPRCEGRMPTACFKHTHMCTCLPLFVCASLCPAEGWRHAPQRLPAGCAGAEQ